MPAGVLRKHLRYGKIDGAFQEVFFRLTDQEQAVAACESLKVIGRGK